MRVFVDTSVFFSAVYSRQGAARDLIRLGVTGKVTLIVSRDVVDEIERNLLKKAPDKMSDFQSLMLLLAPEIVDDPTPEEVQAAEAYTDPKDAFIVAAAKNAQIDYLVTYDRKHLLDPPEVSEQSGLKIVTPDVVVKQLAE